MGDEGLWPIDGTPLGLPHSSPYLKSDRCRPRGHPEFAVERQRDLTEAVMANTREHRYTVSLTWTGNLGSGTSGYRDYSRDYEISAEPVKIAPPPLNGITLTIELSPRVLLPSSTARWLSCSAPATSSASRAVPPLTSATSGRPLATSPGVALIRLTLVGLRPLTTTMSPLSMNASATATAASKAPPGLFRRSSMKPSGLLPVLCRRSCTAAVSAACVLPSNPAMRR